MLKFRLDDDCLTLSLPMILSPLVVDVDTRARSCVVVLAEFFETVSEIIDDLWCCANNNSESVCAEETLRWESHAVLFSQKFFAEVDIVLDVFESAWLK